MKNTMIDAIHTLVNRINMSGCYVIMPFREPSFAKVLFDGSFSSAAYIPQYPATLHIYGMPGQIALTGLLDVEQISTDQYVIQYGENNSRFCDVMIQIIE